MNGGAAAAWRAGVALLGAAALAAAAQGDFLVPPGNLVLDGVPPVPAAIAARVAPYTEWRRSANRCTTAG